MGKPSGADLRYRVREGHGTEMRQPAGLVPENVLRDGSGRKGRAGGRAKEGGAMPKEREERAGGSGQSRTGDRHDKSMYIMYEGSTPTFIHSVDKVLRHFVFGVRYCLQLYIQLRRPHIL